MERNPIARTPRWIAVAATALPLAAFAASGQFTFVTGEVSLTKASGTRSTPTRGTLVDPGDRIDTGANGMAQLTMVDQARLSLRPSTRFLIEQYGQRADANEGAILSLLKGTLRTFTGLIAAGNRDKFVMKTRVATVGIRGSGNILYACDGDECDPSVTGEARGEQSLTVNHTIDGSHAITNTLAPGGRPAQQGGAETVITGPGQTVLVAGSQPPRYIPTPSFIADAATNMTGAKVAAAAPGAASDTRNFAPNDTLAIPTNLQNGAPLVGNNGLGFPTIDATSNLALDPLQLRDVVIAAGAPFSGQSLPADLVLPEGELRGFTAYAQGGLLAPTIAGGTSRDFHLLSTDGGNVTMGRYENATLALFGPGTATAVPGSIHWIVGPSGYPPYLSDVLTGTAQYTLAAATSPTNQNNAAGTLGTATLDVNFSNRTLGFNAAVSIPAQNGNAGGSWQLVAQDVPLSLNAFFGSTEDRLIITNGAGVSSRTNASLSGSFEGSFVGTGLNTAILGYGISDTTSTHANDWNIVTGVAALTGPRQNASAPFIEGRVSDPTLSLSRFVLTQATTNRPDEVTVDAQNRVTRFSAPFALTGTHSTYDLGTAQVVESGFDPATGLVWGRWAGGTATITRGAANAQLALDNSSLHYLFASPQAGPVSLPLTGTATYDVIGSTAPTDNAGHVGTLGSATLAANFTNRTASATVNIGINGQTWSGAASDMPIYRDQYFSAFSGTPIQGIPNPAPLLISCSPNCGTGAVGSFDGFFTGRTGQGAGLMYRLGPNQGAVAFGRRGG